MAPQNDLLTHVDQLSEAEVLIIEDEALMSALMKRYIKSINPKEFTGRGKNDPIRVMTLESGWELLNADLSNVQVAIVDVLLPQITGVDLIRDFRKRYPHLGLVPVTGMATAPMVRSINDLLPEGFALMDKPLRKEEFLHNILKAWEYSVSNSSGPSQPKPIHKNSPPPGEEQWSTCVSTSTPVAVVKKRKIPKKKTA